jgi:hypothetical protein
MRSSSPFRPLGLLAALVGILVTGVSFFWAMGAQPAAAQGTPRLYLPMVFRDYLPPEGRLCRLGVGGPGNIGSYNVAPLRIGWYMDWDAALSPARPGGITYAQTVRLKQTGPRGVGSTLYSSSPGTDTIKAIVKANPGAIWIIGNEPDRITYQDDVEPQAYAQAYHDLYCLIKGGNQGCSPMRDQDPTAQIVAGNIVQPTPLRLQYLEMVLTAYSNNHWGQMPVDIWGLHTYPLNERSCDPTKGCADNGNCWGADIPPGIAVCQGTTYTPIDSVNPQIFQQFVRTFRQWMAGHGYRNSKLFLPEWGVLMPSRPDLGITDDMVNDYMTKTMQWVTTTTDPSAFDSNTGYPADKNRLVQRAAWFSLTYIWPNFNGWLFETTTKARTRFGDNFANQAASIPADVNLTPVDVNLTSGRVVAQVVNNGNISTSTPFVVQFFDGGPGGPQIGQDQTVGLLDGCASSVTVGVAAPTAPGTHNIYVKVDPTNQINESHEDDNTMSKPVTVQ